MANIIVPFMSFMVAMVGKTIDLTNYETSFRYKPIFNASDVVETQVNALNSSYYVLPDGNIPYSKLNRPIDLALGIRTGQNKGDSLDSSLRVSQDLTAASILVIGEYRTMDRHPKPNAIPSPDWQKSVGKEQTHYMDRIMYGSQVVSLINIRSNVTGDIQIIRRVLKEIMGTSGRVDGNTIDSWKKAYNTMVENPDIRGQIYPQFSVYTFWTNGHPDVFGSVESLLTFVKDLPNYAMPPPAEGKNAAGLCTSLKPLHDLDEKYPSMQKNEETERNLMKLAAMERDVEYAYSHLRDFPDLLPDPVEEEFQDYYRKLKSVRDPLRKLMYARSSIFQELNVTAFESAFQKYEEALDSTTDNFVMDYYKMREKIGATCEKRFLKPVRGSLRVADAEAVNKGKFEKLENCQDLCVQDEQCRAVKYDEDRECVIYYRSTRSATILYNEDVNGSKTYDRICK